MEKLLHEQLREYATDKTILGIKCKGMDVIGISGSDASSLADEIEYYYIPRPRFEDGEPVQFGDDIEVHNQSGLLDKGIIQSFHPNKGPVWMISLVGCDHERLVRFDPKTCIIKRPAPKVLDADGVEIKVGDYGYGLIDVFDNRDDMLKVEKLECEYIVVSRANGGARPVPLDSAMFTHERPVFDANGERICKGDTVWDLDSGKRLHVEEFANRERGFVQCSNEEDGDCEDHDARRLTHREPDSLEKLLERMEEYAQKNEGYIDGSKVGGFSKELRALIERGE